MSSQDDLLLDELLRSTFIEEADAFLEEFEEQILLLESPDDRESCLAHLFRIAHSLKGSAASVGFTEISVFAHSTEDLMSNLRTHPEMVNAEIISTLLKCSDLMKNWCLNIRNANEDAPEGSDELTKSLESLKVSTSEKSCLSIKKEEDQCESSLEDLDSEVFEATEIEIDVVKKIDKQTANKSQKSSLLKVEAKKIQNIIDLIGELTVLKSQIYEKHSNPGGENLELKMLDSIVRELYDSTLSMQMTPLKSAYIKLERAVRDASMKLGKEVHFVCEGGDIELDRTIIDNLGDPLVQLVRNAVDHGLDSKEERVKLGKLVEGRITVFASNQGGHVIIEIKDDGRGIPRDTIIEKAVKNDLIPNKETAAYWEDSKVFDLLFQPGFSTADQVSAISGRGVGLDVVKSNIVKLNGRVEVESTIGVGSTFRLILPLTTAILDGVVLTSGEHKFIMGLDTIMEFVTLREHSMAAVDNYHSVLDLRGEYIPIYDLGECLGFEKLDNEDLLVITHLGKQKVGFLVDSISERRQFVLKPTDKSIGSVSGISGAAILGNGKVAMVVDVPSLFQRIHNSNQDLDMDDLDDLDDLDDMAA